MGFISSLLPQSPSSQPRSRTYMVRTSGHARLCFSTKSDACESPKALQVPSKEAEDLWSPARPCASSGSSEATVEHVFSARAPTPSMPLLKEQCRPAICDPCCICLENIEPRRDERNGRVQCSLRCPKCTMVAHASCLARWFSSGMAGSSTSNLPRSRATCPSCRAQLDWDALALEARRDRMPLQSMIRVDCNQAAFNRCPSDNEQHIREFALIPRRAVSSPRTRRQEQRGGRHLGVRSAQSDAPQPNPQTSASHSIAL